jgi:outer membrane protein assembly factor BamD (BamD/ComL family)
MLKKTISAIIIFTVVCMAFFKSEAQPTWTLDPFGKEKKPEKYETRKLGSEKTADKKFTKSRHLLQNTITHYNYYFNANNKLNAVIERARLAAKDDYSKLLPFYAFSLEATSAQKQELDSVILKCTSGILLHDLRNDWIDNLYLLIGKAYYYRQDFDSAAMTLQFINYNLFPRKKGEEDNRVVGGNESASGSNISIANKEKQNLLQKIASLPPSRNDALIWLARTLIEQNELGESAGLINTLHNDVNLPQRLQNDLEEVNAYWFFKQEVFDSAAIHLEKAISNADDKQDKSRREFLLAQLFEMNASNDKAAEYYSKASKHTVDPLLDIYAQLNEAKLYKAGDNAKQLNNSIANLVKMAKKDKFEGYRDIIYYSAGQLALQQPDTAMAIVYFNKSIEKNENNIKFRNKAYLQLGDIAYKNKAYKLASAMYDSIQTGADSTLKDILVQLQARRSALTKVVNYTATIEREDSLQRIAALPPAEREDFVKKLVKKIRKESGLKEDANIINPASPLITNNAASDLFATGNAKGEWYFYNSSLKSRGFNEFKSKWGTRINVDNWRRKAAMDAIVKGPAGIAGQTGTATSNTNNTMPAEVSYESLMQQLPLIPAQTDSSNTLIAESLLNLAKVYQTELEDYEEAVKTYQEYLKRFPEKVSTGDIYLGLYYSYKKLGNIEKADFYKNLLNSKFVNTKAWQILNQPETLDKKMADVTKLYEDIYNQFIEGRFDAALAQKKKADEQYGLNYWTPQLLYIEALYNVKMKNDSVAIGGLNILMQNHPNSPLAEKAATMIDVLKRRKEIETYLTNLQVTRAEEERIIVPSDNNKAPVAKAAPATAAPVVPKLAAITPAVVIKDTVKTVNILAKGQFLLKPDSPHIVLMILDKVAGMYVNEARNALTRYNNENYYGQQIMVNKDDLDADRSLLLISSFANDNAAMEYYSKLKRSAGREMSWLPAAKYSFLIITNGNLQVLKNNKDITGYKVLLNNLYPGKF